MMDPFLSERLSAAGFDPEQLKSSLAASSQAASADARYIASSPALLQAALSGSFLPSQIGIGPDSPEIESVLAASRVVMSAQGQAWQVKPEIRRHAIETARRAGRLASALAEPPERQDDPEGRLLRRVLAGEVLDLDALREEELEALVNVAGWIGGSEWASSQPSIADVRRAQQRRSILDPFCDLVGRGAGGPPGEAKDHFVGRKQQMEQLRAYVGVLPPEELRDYARRALSSVLAALPFTSSETTPLAIEGIGGVGKSSLLAKFVLDHALHPGLRIPFVYYDFDRASLAPRDPRQLLIEASLQLAAYFPGLSDSLHRLRLELRDAIDEQSRSAGIFEQVSETRSDLHYFCGRLRHVLDGLGSPRPPVLFIFDTVELLQYDSEAVQGVDALIATLQAPDKVAWPNLRVVLAGRTSLRLSIPVKLVPLEPLTRLETRQLLRLRCERIGLTLPPDQLAKLAPALQGSPLHVVIVTKWLRQQENRASAIASLVEGLSGADGTLGEDAGLGELLVLGILIRRMIAHIADRSVRAIANPGLVVRAVTPEIIRDVMAPAGAVELTADKDEAAAELFRRLERETWLVERSGGMLRHRVEVRRATLYYMRRHDRSAYARANGLAIAYFRERAEAGDRDAAIELAYHHLLDPDPRLAEADALLSPAIARRLAAAVDDLAGDAKDLLQARLGRRLPLKALGRLPPSAVRAGVLNPRSRKAFLAAPDDLFGLLADRLPASFDDDAPVFGVLAEVFYRSGRWSFPQRSRLYRGADEALLSLVRNDLDNLVDLDEPRRRALTALLRWAARDDAFDSAIRNTARPFTRQLIGGGMFQLPRNLDETELFWNLVIYGVISGMRSKLSASDLVGSLVGRFRNAKQLPAAAHRSGAIRILASLDTSSSFELLRFVDWRSHFSGVTSRDWETFRQFLATDESRALETSNRAALEQLHAQSGALVMDRAVGHALAVALQRQLRSGDRRAQFAAGAALRRSYPDWVEPLGHALTRAFDGPVPRKLGFFSSVDPFLGSHDGRRRRGSDAATGLEILSLADEMRMLPEVVDLYLGMATGAHLHDFHTVADAFTQWRRRLGPGDGVQVS
ncbi:MAG TPA: hypothetical protein VGU24_22035 [Microvirga sp.]|jgi:hypothetical protein|nr:hypothetical protein [Microvirga sp.]